LATTLYYLTETNAPELQHIIEKIRDVEPHFGGFEFNTLGTERVAFSVAFTDARYIVPAVRLSSGTLAFIGLVTLLSTRNRPSVLMIEEPENGLTPQAIEAQPDRKSQIFMSSHSPFLICDAWNGADKDVIFQVKIKHGRAEVTPFEQVVSANAGFLGKVKGGARQHMSLNNAGELMSGYLS
jgi:predicted ATPase